MTITVIHNLEQIRAIVAHAYQIHPDNIRVDQSGEEVNFTIETGIKAVTRVDNQIRKATAS